jgi:alpha-glucosidase (family GH31 glycosyl hydrolase)
MRGVLRLNILLKKLDATYAALTVIGFVLAGGASALAQGRLQENSSGQYSASQEYKNMIEELHVPAPSPAYIATGERPAADANLRVAVHEDQRSLRLTTASTDFRFDKQSDTLDISNRVTGAQWRVSSPNASGSAPASAAARTQPPISLSREVNRWMLPAAPGASCAPLTLEIMTDTLARLTCGTAVRSPDAIKLHVHGGTALFGLGERFWQAGLSATNLDVRPADKSGEPGHNWVYVAAPLIYGPGGLGLYADTAFDSHFQVDSAGSSFDVKVANGPVTFYLFSGDSPKSVLSSYTALTGRPPIPPLWAFGPWVTALQGEDAVLDVARKLRSQGIPGSALWIYDEMDETNNLGWPFWFSTYYRNSRELNDTLHAQGFKVLTYVHPYVREQMIPYHMPSPAYAKGIAEKLLETGPDGLPSGPAFEPVRTGDIDFTNPAAVDWWQTMMTSAVRDQGFDGWMEDFGEWIVDQDRFAAGDGTTISELYPLLYHKITSRIVNALNPSLAPFSRSGSTGSQQFSTVLWGADQAHNWSRDYGLPSVVTAGITAGMSGFSTWGPDILSDGESKELWMRWTEFGALSPVMRDHPWAKPRNFVDLWFDASTTALWKKYAILHSSLLPYFATYADQAHRTGIPIMRHTVLEFPGDPRSATAEYQYLLGEYLLVAPVIEEGALTRKLYLPKGEWVNYWTGEHYIGGTDKTIAAPIDQIPLLVRAGSILPFKAEGETASLQWSDPQVLGSSLVWKVYPANGTQPDAGFSLPNGTSAHFHREQGKITIEGAAKTSYTYEVIVQAPDSINAVRLDDMALSRLDADNSSSQAEGWWITSLPHEVHVKFKAGDFKLTLSEGVH